MLQITGFLRHVYSKTIAMHLRNGIITLLVERRTKPKIILRKLTDTVSYVITSSMIFNEYLPIPAI